MPEFPRISETFIEREVAQLIDWGKLDITVLALAKATGSTSEKVLARTIYRRINLPDLLGGLFYLITKPGKVMKAWRQASAINPYFFAKSLGYTKIIAGLKPQHLHAHFFSWPSTIALIASTILDLPFSVSAHARDVFLESELLTQKINSAKFVSICNSAARSKALELAGPGVDESKVKLIYHGVNPKLFTEPAAKPKWNVPAIFLGGTRLVEKKGLKYMIEASKLLHDKGIAHRVDLVGPGELYQELKNMITDLNLSEVVYLHGNGKGTPFNEVLEFYKLADIFVLPSIETGEGDADGVPTVCIEAAMAKLPIITTNAGGITDLIEDGVTGLIVAQKDPEAIATAIQKLLADKVLADQLAQNAYHKAGQMFNIAQNIGALEQLLLA